MFEYEIEEKFIQRLESIGYSYIEIKNYDHVLTNFRTQLAKFNAKKLEEKGHAVLFSDAEFNRIMIHIDNHSVYESAKILRDKYVLELDDGQTVYIDFFSPDTDRNIYQVTHQVTMDKAHKDDVVYKNRYRCTSCNELFTVTNTVKTELAFNDEKFDTDDAISEFVGIYPFEMKSVDFEEDISNLSPSFVEVYKQAERAEHDGLNLICGMAYRRALEFLVRDYCVDKFSEKIRNYITDDSDIKTLAEKATWLGNDQTHVINKHPDRDVSDIKQFIQMIVAKIKIKMVVADAETIKKG